VDGICVIDAAPDEGNKPGVNLFVIDLLRKVAVKGYVLALLLALALPNRKFEINLGWTNIEVFVALLDTAGITVSVEDGLDIDVENEVVGLDGMVREVVTNIVLVLKGRNTAETVGDKELKIGSDREDIVFGFGPAEVGSAPAIKGVQKLGDTAVDLGIEGCEEGCVHLN
jgi:hypothetical protein